jgi:hypothetical protein
MKNIVSNSKYVVANDWMTESNEVEGMWKEAVITRYMVLVWHLLKGTEEDKQKPQWSQLILSVLFDDAVKY